MSGMSIELNGLAALAVLILIYVSVQSMLQKASLGNAWTVGARDSTPQQNEISGRAKRATENLLETALIYVCLAVVIEFTGRSSAITEWGALVYLIGRAVYLPAYLAGYPWVRTIIWNISTAALAVMLIGLLITPATAAS